MFGRMTHAAGSSVLGAMLTVATVLTCCAMLASCTLTSVSGVCGKHEKRCQKQHEHFVLHAIRF